jgi:hypothetical protein
MERYHLPSGFSSLMGLTPTIHLGPPNTMDERAWDSSGHWNIEQDYISLRLELPVDRAMSPSDWGPLDRLGVLLSLTNHLGQHFHLVDAERKEW